MFARLRRELLLVVSALLVLLAFAGPANAVDPSVLERVNWDQLVWHKDKVKPGSWYAVLSGDPTQPGPWVLVNSVEPGNFNRPHSHPYARQIYVIKGTWWVGTGRHLDPAASAPRGPGSFVDHYAGAVHWDGAKDGQVLLLIGGDGPAIDNFVD